MLGNLAPLRRLLDRHPIVITPHLTAPYADDKHPGELAMSRSGAYNMGFFAVARSAVRIQPAAQNTRVQS